MTGPINGVDVLAALAFLALLACAYVYGEWWNWNDHRKRDRRRHVREWQMTLARDTTLYDRIQPYTVEQPGDTFPAGWAQAA